MGDRSEPAPMDAAMDAAEDSTSPPPLPLTLAPTPMECVCDVSGDIIKVGELVFDRAVPDHRSGEPRNSPKFH